MIKVIIESAEDEITDALNINDPSRTETRNTLLRKEFAKFRKAVEPKITTSGEMHYKHYTTLQQAFDLLGAEWERLSNYFKNYGKCDLVWRQVIGYLQLSLPAVDRFAFARAFDDDRTVVYKQGNGSFPNISSGNEDLSGLGFEDAIWLRPRPRKCWDDATCGRLDLIWKSHVEQKLQTCRTYSAAEADAGRVCNLLE